MVISAVLPLTFVVLWASAFATGAVVTADASPFAALAFRFFLVALGFCAVAAIRQEWSGIRWRDTGHGMVSGALFHGIYLGGCWYAFSVGLPAGITALIVCIQPILTALFASAWLGEHNSRRHWVGLGLGFSGAVIVLGGDLGGSLVWHGFWAAVLALVAITTATLWQKRYASTLPLSSNNAIQAATATVCHLIAVMWLEGDQWRLEVTASFMWAMSWQVLAVSFGAFTILMFLISKNSASQTSALFFLVPPVAALIGFVLLDERLTPVDMVGFLLASLGVYLATRHTGRTADVD